VDLINRRQDTSKNKQITFLEHISGISWLAEKLQDSQWMCSVEFNKTLINDK
jgi:hypothetical protein